MTVREIVGVVFLAALFASLMFWPRTRASVVALLKALFAAPIMITLGVLGLYLALCIAGLNEIGLWQGRDWLLTLYWLAGSAFLTALSTKEISDHPLKLGALLKEALTIAVALQFVAGAYSLAWWQEVLLLPVIAFLAMIAAVAEREARTRSVAVLANVLLGGIGLLFLYNGAATAITRWSEFATVETVRVFFLPVALAAVFAPARIALAHYMTLERLYNGSRMRTENSAIRRYAFVRSLLAFGFDHARVARFYRSAGPATFLDRAHIDARIAELRTRMRREAKPPHVDPAEGWSPYVANGFLTAETLTANDYRPLFSNWQANSKPLTVGANRFAAFIEYYVEGDEHVARRLRLSGYAEPKEDGAAFRGRFHALAAALAKAAIDQAAGARVLEKFQHGADFDVIAAGRPISFRIDDRAVAGGGAREFEFCIDSKPGYDPYAHDADSVTRTI